MSMKQPAYQKTPTKDPQKQYQGTVNKQMGRSFERYIDEALAYYAQRGDAMIMKTPEPMRPTKDLGGGRFVAHHEKKAQTDYKGVLKGGRAIIFEAKYTNSDRMEQDRVTPEQAATLNKCAAMGAECFVVVGFGLQDIFKIPWGEWREMKAHWGRKYVTPADLDRHRVQSGRQGQPLILEDAR